MSILVSCLRMRCFLMSASSWSARARLYIRWTNIVHAMVKTCHNCNLKSFGHCSNGCPKMLRLLSPKDKDFRLVCFRCFQKLTEEKTERFQKHYLRFNERLRQMRAQLEAVHAASAPKNTKQSEEPEECATAASTARSAKHAEEPEEESCRSDEPPPAKKRRQESGHRQPRSSHAMSGSKH